MGKPMAYEQFIDAKQFAKKKKKKKMKINPQGIWANQ
jgi:hypothetical protein